jgi:hypothetical protein
VEPGRKELPEQLTMADIRQIRLSIVETMPLPRLQLLELEDLPWFPAVVHATVRGRGDALHPAVPVAALAVDLRATPCTSHLLVGRPRLPISRVHSLGIH